MLDRVVHTGNLHASNLLKYCNSILDMEQFVNGDTININNYANEDTITYDYLYSTVIRTSKRYGDKNNDVANCMP